MDKFIFLNWFDIKVGRLFYIEENYVFQFVDENIIEAKKKGCPINILKYKPQYKSLMYSKILPIVFDEFLISNGRKDLIKKFNILDSDNNFEILYKIASKSDVLLKKGFWISTQ